MHYALIQPISFLLHINGLSHVTMLLIIYQSCCLLTKFSHYGIILALQNLFLLGFFFSLQNQI